MVHIFKDLNDVVEYFTMLAGKNRALQAREDVAKDRRAEAGTSAATYEYVADAIKNSNLMDARLVFSDADLKAVKRDIEVTITQMDAISARMQLNKQIMADMLLDLDEEAADPAEVVVEGAKVPISHTNDNDGSVPWGQTAAEIAAAPRSDKLEDMDL